ncbi:hypothetical protein PF003_g28140 [Phytophthora fragariae]|nr:hypothetical protein PF003_g28140 [Phytophthora fragariae]
MTSTTETELTFTAEVVKSANIMKRSVYTLIMANLANDVECKVVDPCRELRRLYPTQPAPTDPAVATATLYTHYTQERTRTVNSQIPAAFWAGPEVLRAMAQYLREPLFVLDVDQHNDTHVQRYYYRDYSLPNGDIHETGCGGAMDDATAKTMLGHYARLHVLPVFMMLKRHEGHFNGVHHGDIAIKWHAEGDLDFTQANCRSHSWYEEVKAHIDYSQGLLAQVDYLNDDDATNTILIGAMERRARLDVIHDRLRLDTLDRDPYDIAILESGLEVEEERIHTLAGTGSYDAHPEPAHTTGGHTAATSGAVYHRKGTWYCQRFNGFSMLSTWIRNWCRTAPSFVISRLRIPRRSPGGLARITRRCANLSSKGPRQTFSR